MATNQNGVGITVRGSENIEQSLQRFKRTVKRTGRLHRYKENLEFTKPSKERRDRRNEYEKRIRDRQSKPDWY